MPGDAPAPIAVSSLPGNDAAAVAWRYRGRLYGTVIAKATFVLLPDAVMQLVKPQPVHRAEVHHGDHPARTIRYAANLAPRLQRVDVLFTGHAYALSGTRSQMGVSLAVLDGSRPLLDKELLVTDAAGFQRMPLVYERAVGGIGSHANPLGARIPNIVDPADPTRPASFAPLSRAWPSRRRLLGNMPRGAMDGDGPIAKLPDDFNFAYFQAAPPDQQLDELRGDEWIVLGGLHPSLPVVRTRLPGARAVARIQGLAEAGIPEGAELTLRLDTVHIDGDEQWCSLVWRQAFEVPSEEALRAARIATGLAFSGATLDWPAEAEAPAARAPAGAPRIKDEATFELTGGDLDVVGDQTQMLDVEAPGARMAVVPFRHAAPASPPEAPAPAAIEPPPPPLAGAPPARPAVADELTVAADMEPGPEGARPRALPFDPYASPARAVSISSAAPPAAPIPTGTIDLDPEGHVSAAERVIVPFLSAASERMKAARLAGAPDLYVPPRTSDALPIFTRTPFLACTVPWQLQLVREVRTVVIKGTFDIVPDGRAKLAPEGEPLSGDVHEGDDFRRSVRSPSDFAIWKTRADVTLTGYAYAPGGSSPAAEVGFRFGRPGSGFERRVAVFGDRSWQRGLLATEPEPFERMPLVYERAYGGGDFEKNPLGRGRDPGPDKRVMLPNLEDRDHLIKSPSAAPDPACFAPVPPLFLERASKLGTFDLRWRKRSWPYFPDDFDWLYFQHAPASQQLDELQGDEPFEVWGAHPTIPRITGKLGRVRPRCFAQKTTAAGGAFFEIMLRLDAVHFDIEAMKISAVWRGLLEVNDDDASDVAELYIVAEDPQEKHLDVAQVRARYRAVKLAANPALLASAPANAEQARSSPSPAQQGRVAEKLRAAGLPPVAEAPAAPAQEGPRVEAGDPARGQAMRAEVIQRLAAGASFDGLDLSGADLAGLDFSSRSLARAHFKGARLSGCKLNGANLSGAVLAGADLTDASLEGAALVAADLTAARLDNASFAGADLSLADFSGAQGEGALFRGARGAGARFVEGQWTRARFEEAELPAADFTRATLDEAVFDRARMAEIRLYDARGRKVSFKGAELGEARADGVALPDSALQLVKAAGSVWDKAVLDGSTFLGASLAGAGFARASCAKATFSGADLVEARFEKAVLKGAALVKANLMRASLLGADLTSADMRGANLHAAEVWKAKLRGAQLDLAIVTKTKLEGRA